MGKTSVYVYLKKKTELDQRDVATISMHWNLFPLALNPKNITVFKNTDTYFCIGIPILAL